MKNYILIASLLANAVFLIMIFRPFKYKSKGPSDQELILIRRQELLSKFSTGTDAIIFAGDSHIQQFELAELFHSADIKNRGAFFDTSLGLLNRINGYAKEHPAKIFIEIGANDTNQKIPADSTTNNINSILNTIQNQSPKTQIYLQSIMPNRYNLPQIASLNKRLRDIASTRHITFINLDPYFLDNGLKKQYDSGDGVHLNGEGYLKWRDILKPYL